jgi:hypothetical protein
MMPNAAVATADTLLGYMPQSVEYAGNTTQEVVVPVSNSRDFVLASEKALSAIWITPEEDEAWKDL